VHVSAYWDLHSAMICIMGFNFCHRPLHAHLPCSITGYCWVCAPFYTLQ